MRCRSRTRTGCGRAKRATSPTSARARAATTGPTPWRSIRCDPRASTMVFELGGGLLDLGLDRDQLGELLRRDASAGLPGDVPRPDGGEHGLGLAGGDVLRFACPGRSSASSAWSRPTVWTRRRVRASRRSVSIRKRLELTVELQHPQGLGAHRDHRDRVRIVGVGLAVVTGVEEPHPGSELGRDVNDTLAGLQEALRQRASGAVGALDQPTPGPATSSHRCASRSSRHWSVVNRPEPKHLLALVDDLDRRRQLVGIDPDDHVSAICVVLPPVTRSDMDGEVGIATTSRAVPS